MLLSLVSQYFHLIMAAVAVSLILITNLKRFDGLPFVPDIHVGFGSARILRKSRYMCFEFITSLIYVSEEQFYVWKIIHM